jgi:ubiquinone/menaquinone biosynthesis C-methylase UbiE
MTVTPIHPDLAAVKARQQKTWASGDFSMVGSRIVLTSERLADAAELRAGSTVLDVACGSGNATIAAARHGTHAVGVDYVPELLDDARARAAAEGLDVEFHVGDAEALPVADSSFDAVLSVFGTMFAPDHQKTADEIVRAAKPGATVALASWTPDGFLGEMFGVITSHVPAPAGVPSPMLWGREDHLVELFGSSVADIRSSRQTQMFRYRSADEFVDFFRRWYGPTVKAFEALDDAQQVELFADLAYLARRWDRHADGGSIAIPGEYLESVITLR